MPNQQVKVMCECGNVMVGTLSRFYQCICGKSYAITSMGNVKKLYRCISTKARLEVNERRIQ